MPSVKTIGEDAAEQRVIDNIAEFGWHCVGISGDDEGPPYAFSIGLFHSFGHPELILFGLRGEVSHEILTLAVAAIRRNDPLDLASTTDELLEGYRCCFAEVPTSNYHEYVGFCRWYYGGSGFPLFQVVWPSRDGLFPWHPDAPLAFKLAQPVISSAPVGI